jgi:hypothetical protein
LISEEEKMFRQNIVFALLAFFQVTSAQAQDTRQLSCEGSMIEPTGLKPSPVKMRLTIGPNKNLSIDTGGENPAVRFVSDNNLQLKFTSKDFTGEYFHYTSDLFLIYRSKHLARLTCKPV